MTAASAVGVLATLGLVLGLLALTLWTLRRVAPGLGGTAGRPRLRMEVVQRLGIGPRQGVAVVRIGERLVALSLGDGGVRPLLELSAEEARALLAPDPATEPAQPGPPALDFRALLRAARRGGAALLVLGGTAGLMGVPGNALAQVATTSASSAVAPQPTAQRPVGTATEAPSVAAARADTIIRRLAPQIDLRVGEKNDGLRLSGTVGVVIMMGLLTLLPTLLLMMTSFTRILIVLHFLRQALGTQSAPPAQLIAGLALLLTGFVMAPTLSEVNRTALRPWMDGKMEQAEMLAVGAKPFREFMLRQVRERDLETFVEMSAMEAPKSVDDVPLVVVVSAFVTAELRTAFQIGFALFLPFMVIDVVVSSVLMSMGMFMLPPAMISLPFKLLLFVLVDGWSLIVRSLVASFQ